MSLPIEIGTADEFAALRDLLREAEYTEERLCSRFGIDNLSQFEDVPDRNQVEPWDKDAAGVLFRLLIEARPIEESMAADRLGPENLALLANLGILHKVEENPNDVWAPVSLVPYAGLWLVCDSWHRPDRSVLEFQDPVYTPIVSNAHRFFELMPKQPCSRLLELCSGTAFAALHAAKHYAGEAYAFDISPRSVHYAEFNRQLNDVPNAHVREGDLYAPAGNLTFDRIIVHPPYVPVLRRKWVFQDGGIDGEAITKRVIAEAPAYLAPGGSLYMLAMGSDREAPYEQRIRAWLGDHQAEFDTAVFPIRIISPEDFALRVTAGSPTHAEDQYELRCTFDSLGIRSMVYSVVMIERKSTDRPSTTIRRQFGPRTGSHELEWAMAWEKLVAGEDAAASILQSRPIPNPEAGLRILHKLAENGWEEAAHTLLAQYPFSMEARVDPWAPFLMATCDGAKTVKELLAELQETDVLPQGALDEEFARAVAILVSGGFLFLQDRS